MAKDNMTHSVMPKKLAEALMDASVQHFAAGGMSQQNTGDSANIRGTIAGPNTAYGQTIGNKDIDPLGAGINNGFMDTMGSIQDQTLNHYQATAPGISTQNFQPRIDQQYGQQQETYAQQQNLANMLLAQSQGQGPNPAQAQYNQNVGQAAKAQGSLMASQRGASSNPALIARQAAMQGAAMQNQASGQAATLQAQQQLAAQQALQQQQQSMASNALQGQNIQLQGAAAQNQTITQGQLGAQNINANVANQNSAQKGNMLGGLLSGGGAASSLGSMFASGGEVSDPQLLPFNAFDTKQDKGKGGGGGAGVMALAALQKGGNVPGKAAVKGNSLKNDKVPALLSPGEVVIPRSITESPDMEKKAIEFLKHIKGKSGGYKKVADAKKMCGGGMAR